MASTIEFDINVAIGAACAQVAVEVVLLRKMYCHDHNDGHGYGEEVLVVPCDCFCLCSWVVVAEYDTIAGRPCGRGNSMINDALRRYAFC